MATRSGDMGGMTTSAFAGAQPDVPGRVDTAPPAGLTRWERPEGGSVEAERALFDQLGKRIMLVQLKNQKKAKAPGVARAFHAKTVLGVENARLRVLDDIPADLCVGFVQPGAEYPTTVRLSNASGTPQADHAGDMRGMALRVRVSPDEQHDLLATNFPVSHARDAKQFVAFAEAMARQPRARHREARLRGRALARCSGWCTTSARPPAARSAAWRSRPTGAGVRSCGARPGRCATCCATPSDPRRPRSPCRPTPSTSGTSCSAAWPRATWSSTCWSSASSTRSGRRSRTGRSSGPRPSRRRSRWPSSSSRSRTSGRGAAVATEAKVDQLAFNPWHTTEEFRPLGNLNRARKAVYAAGSAHRLSYRFAEAVPWRNRVLGAFNERSTSRHQPVPRLVPPAAVLPAPAAVRLPRRAAALEPDRHRGRARRRPRPGRSTTRSRSTGGPPAPSTGRTTISPTRRWARSAPRSAATCRRSTGPTCSTPRTRSWSAASCSRARASSRPARSTSWPPPGSSSRSTTGSTTPASSSARTAARRRQGPDAPGCDLAEQRRRAAEQVDADRRQQSARKPDAATASRRSTSATPPPTGGTARRSTAPTSKARVACARTTARRQAQARPTATCRTT